jgi:hypothetical protein
MPVGVIQQHIGGLDIPVHHPLPMGIVQRFPYLGDEAHHLRQRQRTTPQPGAQLLGVRWSVLEEGASTLTATGWPSVPRPR